MWLSDLSIKRPVFITMIFTALTVIGLIAYGRMGIDLWPNVSFPFVAVQTPYPGAGPQETETQVSKPIEEAVGSLSGVKTVRSSSSEGLSLVMIEFQLEHPASQAVNDVQERVRAIRASLPRDIEEPVILRFDPNSLPIMTLAVADKSGSLTPDKLRRLASDKIKPRLERLPGVAGIEITGGLEREIQVELSAERLKAQELDPQKVVAAIASQNLNIPAGRIDEGDREISLRTPGDFRRLEDIGQVVIAYPAGVPLRVKDVATVKDGFKEVRTYARLDGKDSLGVSVRKQSDTNTVAVAKQVHAEVARLLKDYPHLDIIVASDFSEYIERSIGDTRLDLVIGAVLAALIVFIFFRSVSNTLVTVAGLPVILVGAFWVMSLLGFTVNMMTLLSLSLCIGLLIDDAIVVRENIFRHMDEGEEPKQASSKGTGEVALAVISMTLCVVSVFLPIAFTRGIVGKFLKEFGLTVTAAVLISLFEAFTLAPMMTARFLKKSNHHAGNSRGDQRAAKGLYQKFLTWGLAHRLVVVGGAVVVFFGSLAVVPFIGQTFFAESERADFQMYLELPPGTSLHVTSDKVREIERGLAQRPEVKHVFANIGSSNGPEYATIFVKLDDKSNQQKIQQFSREQFGNLGKLFLSAETMSGASSSSVFSRPIQIEMSTTGDFDELAPISERVMQAIDGVRGLEDIDRSLKPGKPELGIEVNRELAGDLRLNVAQVGSTARILINGERASRFRQGDEEVDILVRLREEDRRNPREVLALPLLNTKDIQLPLSSVAKLAPASGPSQIDRRDRERIITVGANFHGRAQGDVVADVEKQLKALNLPPEVKYRYGGETEMMYETFGNLFFALGLSVVFVYMVLASLYGSFSQPLLIMLALPLSLIGALLALLVTHKSLDMMAMIGVILLMGIVAKNSIIMVDFINMKRDEGLGVREAILTAAPLRLRPIMMTTLALIFGMLAIAIGFGSGGEFRAPMAITVIGGLTTSTFLSLVVVPVAYSFFGRKKESVVHSP